MASLGIRCAASVLSLLLVAPWASVSHGQSTPATSRSSYFARVDIYPSASCKAHFTEEWWFPYTTGKVQTWRDIGLDGDQRVSNVNVRIQNTYYSLPYQHGWNNGLWRISWYTSTSYLSYQLTYHKDNTIRHCGGNATIFAPGTYTARFATGNWTEQMNKLTVVFWLGFVPSARPSLAVSVNGVRTVADVQYSGNRDWRNVIATLNGPLFSNQDAVFSLTYDYGSSPGPVCNCSASGKSSVKGGLVGGIIGWVVVLIILLSCGIACLGLCMSTKTTCTCSRCDGHGYLQAGGVSLPPAPNGMDRDVAPSSPPPPPVNYDQAPVTGVPYQGIPQSDTKGLCPRHIFGLPVPSPSYWLQPCRSGLQPRLSATTPRLSPDWYNRVPSTAVPGISWGRVWAIPAPAATLRRPWHDTPHAAPRCNGLPPVPGQGDRNQADRSKRTVPSGPFPFGPRSLVRWALRALCASAAARVAAITSSSGGIALTDTRATSTPLELTAGVAEAEATVAAAAGGAAMVEAVAARMTRTDDRVAMMQSDPNI